MGTSGETYSVQKAKFDTTCWGQVAQAGNQFHPNQAGALEELCRTYWHPIYFFIRRQGHGEDDAKDHTQNFLHQVISGSMLANANPEESKFRTYLLRCCTNYLHNQRDMAMAQKRGGGAVHIPIDFDDAEDRYQQEIADQHTPEQVYDQDWAFTLVNRAMDQLSTEYHEKGEGAVFVALQPALLEPDNLPSYKTLAEALQLTEENVQVKVFRLREKFRKLLQNEVRRTLNEGDDLNEEIRYLMSQIA